ncbi:hypothetical protein N7532_007325 [Penicillium argentinense]|uniref:Uncharacterized protein n=1 Tax=Penicillium argentinense TaxID=1131581 RepID=A0A9W9F7I2_9EURO|nr:uncharacterized protein N7532_007325 [Penicillium argentinense]KAJ5095034.1 hypothetical protein N7532_007325 [Penicillium argentinense]
MTKKAMVNTVMGMVAEDQLHSIPARWLVIPVTVSEDTFVSVSGLDSLHMSAAGCFCVTVY